MKNVLHLLKRDFSRLIKSPAVLVVVLVLVVLPCFYTWFNVIGFWDPYGHTGNLRVCVVNEDTGDSSDITGQINMGDEVVDELHDDHQLGWVFTDRVTAMDEVRSGKAYAVFVIPSDFTSNTLSLLTGDFHQPTLDYYVNEKAGGISTKVTDTGSRTLQQTINSTFVSTVSGVVTQVFDSAVTQAQGDISSAQNSVIARLNKVSDSLSETQSTVSDLGDQASQVAQKARNAKDNLSSAKDELSNLSGELNDAASLLSSTQEALGPFTVSLMSTLDSSSILASQAVSQANGSVGAVTGVVSEAQGTVSSALDQGKALVNLNEGIIETLNSIAAGIPDGDQKNVINQTIETLKSQNDSLKASVDGMQSSYDAVNGASGDIASASNKVNDAIQTTLSNTNEYRSQLSSTTFPALNNATTQLSSTTYQLAGAVSNQMLLVDQALGLLDQLAAALDQTASTLGDTDGLLLGVTSDIDSIKTDVAALTSSEALSELFGGTLPDSSKIADFMLAPTQVQTIPLYTVNSYGTAMSPLFMNLTLWIGVFMLLVIMRIEVDREGLPGLTARQAYLGRMIFLGVFASLQALTVCTGNLIIGVQVASVPLFYLTALTASWTYLAIQYALAVLLQHIGKGLCVVLIFVQIPGATGLYPIEMTPAFFQAIYPAFPFTFGINALRETIAGFYGLQWLELWGIMLAFMAVFLVIGLVFRPLFVNLNRMFARQIKDSDIFNGEEAQLPARRYRVEKLMGAMMNRREFRTEIIGTVNRFMRFYDHVRRTIAVVGFGIAVALTVVMVLMGASKVALLTLWLVWLVLLLLFVLIVEFIRDRLMHEEALSALSEDEVRNLFDIHRKAHQVQRASSSSMRDTPSPQGDSSSSSFDKGGEQ